MSGSRALVAAAAVATILTGIEPVAGAPIADGSEFADLRLRGLPFVDVTTLRMRPVALQLPPQPGDVPTEGGATEATEDEEDDGDTSTLDPATARRARLRRQARDLALRSGREVPLEERVIFRFNIGFGLDGGEPSGEPMATGSLLNTERDYAKLRSYAYGDAVIGSRGLVAPSLSTYLAAQFRFDAKTGRESTAVPSVRDNNDVGNVLIRSAFAEADGFFDHKLLKPLFIRAGRQFRYGPAIAHFDGATFGYENRAFRFTVFGGQRVSLYGLDRGVITGSEMRFDMYQLRRVPLVISGSTLSYESTNHFEGGMAVRWSKNALMRASFRVRGVSLARLRLQLRARFSDTTIIRFELENRAAGDWLYDLVLSEPAKADATDATTARRYLNLGAPLPRAYAGLRGGTVVLSNIDVLFRAGAALEHENDDLLEKTSFSASFVEAGGAAEVRLRRAVAVGVSVLWRRFFRDEESLDLTPNMADPLPATTEHLGEKSFIEGGLNLRYTAGARRFSANAEMYTRGYRFYSPYLQYLPTEYQDDTEFRSGARFGVDGWAGKRLRLRAEYDLTLFAPVYLAPELRGMKSLRVLAEGSF